ncbi:MAG: NAD-dependent epimerase/dehydratase family protein [candidate division Zixibacteria bacterium]|nr:NAD-dependent epimerase/dehydratase family protein [candidate division Zixibacteria bacterium]
MKVFVTGASGYIGHAVALAIRRAGHEVWGLVRAAERVAELARDEVHAVVGRMEEPDSYAPTAGECNALVHTAQDHGDNSVALDKKTIEALVSLGRKGPQPKSFIYTSGVWVYGDTGGRLVDETTPPKPAQRVIWRPEHEQMVLRAEGMRTVVVRPGCVYGRRGGLPGSWFAGALADRPLRVVGDGNNRWAMVHVDDLATGYVCVLESAYTREIFNFTDRSRATIREMTQAAVRAAGYGGAIEFVPVSEASKTLGSYAECLALDQHVDSRKAVRLLGWQPAHGGFVDEVETYFAAWKAQRM